MRLIRIGWDAALRTQQQAPATAQAAESVPSVEREQERIAFKEAHQHLELYEVPDAWGRPMFKHSHVEASWLGWIARAARAPADSVTAPVGGGVAGMSTIMEKIDTLIASINGAHDAKRPDWKQACFDAADLAYEQIKLMLTATTPPTQAADSVLEDAARYRYLRDGDWREHEELESVIRLQLNTLWDAKIDAARAAQEGK